MIVDASYAPGVPAPKPLTERIAYVFLSAAALLDESHKTKDPNELIKRKTASQSKSQSQPKPATGGKAATAAGNGRRGRRTARRGGGRASNRPKPKTTEELDAEMDDYFDTTENGAAPTTAAVNGQAQPGQQQQQQQPAAANGGDDVGMAEISVSFIIIIPRLTALYSCESECVWEDVTLTERSSSKWMGFDGGDRRRMIAFLFSFFLFYYCSYSFHTNY